MSKFKKKEVEQPDKPVCNHGCAAHGCPMRGTMCAGTMPDEYTHWYCRFHIKSAHSDFYAVTEKIKEYITMLQFAHKIKTCNSHDVNAYYRTFKDPQFEKTDEENQMQYANRLNAFVSGEIRKVMSA